METGSLLLRGATLLTQNDELGEFRGDLLVRGELIAGIAPRLEADATEVVDARDLIVMPGLIDTHRHTWQSALRHIGLGWDLRQYLFDFYFQVGARYTPDDVYWGTLLGAMTALDAGITTLRDQSNIQNSPAHADAAIQALRDAGIRAVFDHGWPANRRAWLALSQHPRTCPRHCAAASRCSA
ncbi:MAG: amidohydrolase family protein [Aquabacterium sp.]